MTLHSFLEESQQHSVSPGEHDAVRTAPYAVQSELYKCITSCDIYINELHLLPHLTFFWSLIFLVLIYKEVSDWEEWTRNGVIRGQPPPLGE